MLAETVRRVRKVGEQRVRGVERMWQRSLQAGYGLNRDDVVPELTSVAVATGLPAPWSLGSVVITAPSDAMDAATIAATVRVLRSAAQAFEQRAAGIVALPRDDPGHPRSSFAP